MEEEEEVDIVGGEDAYISRNEQEISCLDSGQILTCDYTVHPQWLADNADATVHWANFPKQSSQDEMEMVQDEVVIEEPAPIDFAWCEEVSNCGGDIILLDQDIPTTQEEEVFTNSPSPSPTPDDVDEVVPSSVMSPTTTSAQYTTSYEQQQPSAQAFHQLQHQHQQRIRTASVSSTSSTASNHSTATNPRSLLKRNLLIRNASTTYTTDGGSGSSAIGRPPSKFRQTLLVNRSVLKPPAPLPLQPQPQAQLHAQQQPQYPQQQRSVHPLGGLIPAPIVNRIHQAAAAKVPPPTTMTTAASIAPPTSTTSSAQMQRHRTVPTTIRTVPSSTSANTTTGQPQAKRELSAKFRQTMKVPKSEVFQNKRMRQLSKELRLRNQGSRTNSSAAKATGKTASPAPPSHPSTGVVPLAATALRFAGKKFVSLHGENITIDHEAESGCIPNVAPTVSHVSLQRPTLRPPTSTCYAAQSEGNGGGESDDVDIESDDDDDRQPAGVVQQRPIVHVDLQSGIQQKQQLHIGPSSAGVQRHSSNKHNTTTTNTIVSSSMPTSSSSSQTFPAPFPTLVHHRIDASTAPEAPYTTIVHPPELAAALNSLGVPDAPIDIDQSHVSALEKYFHHEFFEGRPTKTPERFMKIRNYIIKTWTDTRPAYVSKTAVRHGLKNCGDVNCISRIHSLLEQIGAINFGCEQLQYVRPLRELSEIFAQPTAAKSKQHQTTVSPSMMADAELLLQLPERRQRAVRPTLLLDGATAHVDANYTVSHEDGRILLPSAAMTTVRTAHRLTDSSDEDYDDDDDDDDDDDVDDKVMHAISGNSQQQQSATSQSQPIAGDAEQSHSRRPTRHKKPVAVRPEFQLIECARFNRRDRPAPFRVSITMSTLMCLQLHSLSARHEVMGFLGGHREHRRGGGVAAGEADGGPPVTTLRLNRYKPCATSAQSGTMCEMCPVSQVQQSANLIADGYDILGWFHSHPAFPPNPSRTDVATQANMQLQFSFDQNRPFIGFILGCVDMKFKCVYVLPGDVLNVNERTVPYELDVEIIRDCSNFSSEIADVFDVIKTSCDDYSLVLKKFTTYAKVFLQRHGYGKDVLAGLNNIIA